MAEIENTKETPNCKIQDTFGLGSLKFHNNNTPQIPSDKYIAELSMMMKLGKAFFHKCYLALKSPPSNQFNSQAHIVLAKN